MLVLFLISCIILGVLIDYFYIIMNSFLLLVLLICLLQFFFLAITMTGKRIQDSGSKKRKIQKIRELVIQSIAGSMDRYVKKNLLLQFQMKIM